MNYKELLDSAALAEDYDLYQKILKEQKTNQPTKNQPTTTTTTTKTNNTNPTYQKPSTYSPSINNAGYGDSSSASGYLGKYTSQLDSLMSEIMNNPKFSYDYTQDPLYRQYEKSYRREGARSMEDTLGEASANTGGLASSYAVTAAQQAGDYYASKLGDKIPELEQSAYSKYLSDIEDKQNRMALLQSLDATEYKRYIDERDYQAALAKAAAVQPTQTGVGSGGSSIPSGGDTGYTGPKIDNKSILSLGRGPISASTLENLIAKGDVGFTSDGNTVKVFNLSNPSTTPTVGYDFSKQATRKSNPTYDYDTLVAMGIV